MRYPSDVTRVRPDVLPDTRNPSPVLSATQPAGADDMFAVADPSTCTMSPRSTDVTVSPSVFTRVRVLIPVIGVETTITSSPGSVVSLIAGTNGDAEMVCQWW